MCTSLIYNGKKTIVGWNLDILDMEYRVTPSENAVYIEINDKTEGGCLFSARTGAATLLQCLPAGRLTHAAEPVFPRFLYKIAGNAGFAKTGKENGLGRADLKRRIK